MRPRPKAVWEAVTERLKDPSLVTGELERIAADSEAQAERSQREVTRLEREAEQVQVKQRNLVKALAEGTVIPRTQIEAEYAELEETRRGLLSRIGELSAQRDDAQAQALSIESVKDAYAMLARGIDNLNFEERRHVAELVITQVVATKDKATVPCGW